MQIVNQIFTVYLFNAGTRFRLRFRRRDILPKKDLHEKWKEKVVHGILHPVNGGEYATQKFIE